jgi:hypothetical protein
MSALREFCPHCGTPTSRSLGGDRPEALDADSDEELKRNRRKVFVIGAAIVLAMGVIGKISWFPAAITFASHERSRGPVVIDAEQVYDAYRDNARKASKRFRGREMVVSGEFLRVVPDSRGEPDLRFKTSNPDGPLGADLVKLSQEAATRLQPGQRVTVSCQRITGSREDHWLQNCAIQSVGPGSASAAAPIAPAPPEAPGEGNKG